jgi:hypothetical protein
VAARIALWLGGCLAAAVVLHLPALGQPLDRDTALYAAIGQRLGPDTLPYRDLFDHKQPLVHWVYGALEILAPGSLAAIRLAAAIPSALAAALLGLFLQGEAGTRRAVLAAAIVLVAGASNVVQGTDLNTEHLLMAPSTLTVVWALSLGRRGVPGGPFAVGVAGGVAVLAKAIGGVTALAALIPLLAGGRSRRGTLARFAAGLALPAAVVAAGYAAAGGLDDLVLANLTYNRLYVADEGFALAPQGPPAVQLLMAAALVSGLVRLAGDRRDVLAWTLLAWLAGAWLGAQASSRGFPHYYAPLVPPAAALLVLPPGPALRVARIGAVALGAVAAVLIALPVVANAGRDGDAIARTVYGSEELAKWRPADELGPLLRQRAEDGDELFVAGSEPQYYWRSGLPAANRWLFDYPADVIPETFGPEVADLCRAGPRFVVVTLPRLPAYARACGGYARLARRGAVVVLERR